VRAVMVAFDGSVDHLSRLLESLEFGTADEHSFSFEPAGASSTAARSSPWRSGVSSYRSRRHFLEIADGLRILGRRHLRRLRSFASR
jgi:hypothetical protein